MPRLLALAVVSAALAALVAGDERQRRDPTLEAFDP